MKIDTNISDIFFNLEHPKWDALHTKESVKLGISEDNARESLKEDAEWFCSAMNSLGHQVEPKDIIDDFFSRL